MLEEATWSNTIHFFKRLGPALVHSVDIIDRLVQNRVFLERILILILRHFRIIRLVYIVQRLLRLRSSIALFCHLCHTHHRSLNRHYSGFQPAL